LTTLEDLEQYADDHHVRLLTCPLPCRGLYYACPADNTRVIALSPVLETDAERAAVLAEELGHYHTTPIDLFTAPRRLQVAYERRAAEWAASTLLPVKKLVMAWRAGVRSAWELAEYCDVPESFTTHTLELYAARYARGITCDGCLVTFDLLHIREVI
jgi:hypothetical protein